MLGPEELGVFFLNHVLFVCLFVLVGVFLKIKSIFHIKKVVKLQEKSHNLMTYLKKNYQIYWIKSVSGSRIKLKALGKCMWK